MSDNEEMSDEEDLYQRRVRSATARDEIIARELETIIAKELETIGVNSSDEEDLYIGRRLSATARDEIIAKELETIGVNSEAMQGRNHEIIETLQLRTAQLEKEELKSKIRISALERSEATLIGLFTDEREKVKRLRLLYCITVVGFGAVMFYISGIWQYG